MAHLPFNSNDVQGDMQDFSTPIPEGKYRAVIVKTVLGETKGDKHTQQLQVVWQVVGGDLDGRQVSNYITVRCDNPEARDIGQRFLKNICEAIGLASFVDTDEMCGREHVVGVGFTKPRDDGKKYNEVKRCYPAGESVTPAPTTQAAPVAHATPPPVNNPKPPWANP